MNFITKTILTFMMFYIGLASVSAQEPPTRLQTTAEKPDKLTGLITFAFYKDIEAAENFYVNIMGLTKSYHRPITRVFLYVVRESWVFKLLK
jgi:hypothetical protein